jgi:hypothetical protein
MSRINFTPNLQKFYGAFYDTTNQIATSASVAYPITMNNTDISNGVTVNSSSITFKNSGIYDIQFSLQIADNGTSTVSIWMRKNGVNLDASTGVVSTTNQNHYAIPSWNYLVNVSAGDVYQFYWSSTTTSSSLVYAASTALLPSTPSMSVSVAQV